MSKIIQDEQSELTPEQWAKMILRQPKIEALRTKMHKDLLYYGEAEVRIDDSLFEDDE